MIFSNTAGTKQGGKGNKIRNSIISWQGHKKSISYIKEIVRKKKQGKNTDSEKIVHEKVIKVMIMAALILTITAPPHTQRNCYKIMRPSAWGNKPKRITNNKKLLLRIKYEYVNILYKVLLHKFTSTHICRVILRIKYEYLNTIFFVICTGASFRPLNSLPPLLSALLHPRPACHWSFKSACVDLN